MGNHTDDCPACGEDRRSRSVCCAAEAERIAAERRAHEQEQADRRALFDRLGIEHRDSPHYRAGQWITLPQIDSLLAFLRKLP